MTPTQQQLIQDIEKLIPAKLKFQQNVQSGLQVLPGHGGIYLTNVSLHATQHVAVEGLREEGMGRNFTRAQRDWIQNVLAKQYPQYDFNLLLSRSVETARRIQGLGARFGFAQDLQTRGEATMLESLDTDTNRAQITNLDPEAPDKIPRAATWVRLKPDPPTRYIVQTEFSLEGGKIRPDEVMISYHLSDDELKLVKQGTKFDAIPASVRKATNLDVICYDVNRELSLGRLEEHFSKTMNGLRATAEYMVAPPPQGWGLIPVGKVFFRAKDSYVGNMTAVIDGDVRAVRETEKGTNVFISLLFEQKTDKNGVKQFVQVGSKGNLKLKMVQDIIIRANLSNKARVLVKDLKGVLKNFH